MTKRSMILLIAVLALAGVLTAITIVQPFRTTPAADSFAGGSDTIYAALEEESEPEFPSPDSSGSSVGRENSPAVQDGISEPGVQEKSGSVWRQDRASGASEELSETSASSSWMGDESESRDGSQPQGQSPSSSRPAPSKPQEPSAPQAPSSSAPVSSSSNPESSGSGDTEEAPFVQQVVELVNQERAKAGLEPLSVSHPAQRAAQIRAKEIQVSFSHTRPNGSSPFTALTEQKASYRSAGENIAWGQKTPQQVMQGWMNSDGHRANILSEKFTAIGVGYYLSESGVPYWTQLFIG